MSPCLSQRGVVLLSVLGVLALATPVVTMLHLQARTDAWIVRNARHHAQCLRTAEAGIARAVAVLRESPLANPEAGPDGKVGTEDDGLFPFPSDHDAAFPDFRYRYEVRAARITSNRIALTSTATGPHGTTRVLRVIIAHGPDVQQPHVLAYRELR